jgi:peptidoglycan/LPS O-acetylase OafA/YrhL
VNQQRLGYRPALDGVRAVAILAVVAFHAIGRPTGGFLGVDIFFVLSGFLITTLLLEEWETRKTISLGHFYLRRALRLLPALVVAVVAFGLLTLLAAALGRQPGHETLGNAGEGMLFGLLYVSNIVQAAGIYLPGGIGHLWSLATEEQFYLLWPPCLYAALRLGASRRLLSLGLAALVAALALHRTGLTLMGAPQRRLYYAPDASFDLILVGCLAAILFTSKNGAALLRVRRTFTALSLPVAAAVAAAMLSVTYFDRWLYAGFLLPFAIAVALLLLAVALDEGSYLGRFLMLRPMVYVGKISYALYLWHQVVLGSGLLPSNGYAEAALGVPLSFAAAAASYRFVERPFLRLKRRDRERIEERASEPTPAERPVPATAT